MRDQHTQGGLFHSITVFAQALVSIVHTRLELLSTDLEEDRQHLFTLMGFFIASIFSLMVGVVLCTLLIVILFWDSHRILVLASLAGFFLLVGFAACGVGIHKAKTKPKLFLASLLELFKDTQHLSK
jgi:uncharacterized membrane protein YqjE